jgi:hypothetical protein
MKEDDDHHISQNRATKGKGKKKRRRMITCSLVERRTHSASIYTSVILGTTRCV